MAKYNKTQEQLSVEAREAKRDEIIQLAKEMRDLEGQLALLKARMLKRIDELSKA